MNTQQMILMEYLVDDILSYEVPEEYKIVFEINNNLYTGDFLQQDEFEGNIRRYTETPSPLGSKRKESMIFKIEASQLREEFLSYAGVDDNIAYTNLISMKPLFLKILIAFILDINPDQYLKATLEFPSVIYNFTDVKTNKSLEFYLINSQSILPVSLLKI